jgi:hypothetical protein
MLKTFTASLLAAAIALPSNGLAAQLKPSSKEGAIMAGQFRGAAENCFGKPDAILTTEARRFAAAAEKTNPRWYYESYNAEVKGADAYDEPFCNEIVFKNYEKGGVDSRRLGFRIMNTDAFAD